MPNSFSPSSIAATASLLDRLEHHGEQPAGAEEVALPQMCAADGSAEPGCSTRETSGRPSSQRAISSPARWCWASRVASVRRPRSAEERLLRAGADAEQLLGRRDVLGGARIRRDGSRASRRRGRRCILSPPGSTRRRRARTAGNSSGVAQVLSISSHRSRAAATRAIAGMSCTSNVCEPGLSVKMRRVLGRTSSAMPAPISGS